MSVGIRALMIDVDGVIVRSLFPGWRWDQAMENDLGLRREDLARAFFEPHWSEIIVGKATLEERLGPVLAEIKPNVPVDSFLAYWFAKDANLDKNLLGELAALRAEGFQLHLVTNQEHRRAAHLWTTLGLSDRFDAMHYSAELGLAKPDPAFFAAVRARTGLLAGELLLIDDAQANVAAARASGWQALQWTGDRSLPALIAAAEIRLG
jgi:putative hydrolase of the HAD superfamily